MKQFTKTIDTIAINLLILIISFIWFRYNLDSLWLSIFLSILTTFLLYVGFKLLFRFNSQKKALTKTEQKQKNDNITNLAYATKQKQIDFLYELLSSENLKIKKQQGYLLFNNSIIIPCFANFSMQCFVDAISLSLSLGKEKLIIACKSVPKDINKLSKSISPLVITFLNENTLFSVMQAKNVFPEKIISISKQKLKFGEVLNFALNKKRVKSYLFMSGILILSSFLTPFKLYYFITATILLGLALFSLLNTAFNQEKENEFNIHIKD